MIDENTVQPPHRAEPAAAPREPGSSGEGADCALVESVCFRLAGTTMAIPIEQVSEAVEPLPITPIFHLPHWVRGLAALRGDILLILDLADLIDLPSHREEAGRVLVVRAQGRRWGVIVEEIVGVKRLSRTPTGARHQPGIPSWALGLFTDGPEPVLLLDMNRLAQEVGTMAPNKMTSTPSSRGDNGD